VGETRWRRKSGTAKRVVERTDERTRASGEGRVVAVDREDRADMHTERFVAGCFGASQSDVDEPGTEASGRRGGMFFGAGGDGGESGAGAF